MKTPNLWQKLVAGFKKPFQRKPKETPRTNIPEGTGGYKGISHYQESPLAYKLRKRKKRAENKSRAVNAKINKTWKR